jgi:FAD/FMN-containing dehydrogenase
MVVTQVGSAQRIEPFEALALRTRLLGEVVLPGDDSYDEARRIVNLAYDRHPALIVRAADAGDVIRAVEFARARDLPLAVRSGSHSIAGHSAVDDGVVVDLSRMKGLSIDPVRRTAWAQPGVTSRDLFEAAQPHNLALSTGDTESVGLGGLTTGGGIGWLVRKQGLTIDNLLSVEVVTADGRIVVANADQNSDLFWAVRGGGGNFGVITGFEFQLHAVPEFVGGVLVLPATAEIVHGYLQYAAQAPDELTTLSNVMLAPPMPFLPADAHGAPVLMIFVAYAGDLAAAQPVLEPLRALGTPIADLIGAMPYADIYKNTEFLTAPHYAHIRSGYMHEMSLESAAAIVDHVVQKPAPAGLVHLRGLGGAMARVPSDATAFAHRHQAIFLAIINMGGGEEVHRLWTERLWQQLRSAMSGVYVNFLGDEGEARVREAYPPDTYARLAEIKRRYDPTNLFRLNQNIPPAE